MQWKDEYRNKLVSPGEAAGWIKSGDRIFINACAGQPRAMVSAIAEQVRKNNLHEVTVHQFLTVMPTEMLEPGYSDGFTNVVWFAGPYQRQPIWEGRATHMVSHFSEVPRLIRDYTELNAFVMEVSPMDEFGFFSMGTAVAYARAAIEKAGLLILEVNENQPRVFGDSWVHISEADLVVENNKPLPDIPNPPMSEEDTKIGEMVADLVEDGSTIQIGYGGIPSAVARALLTKKELGIHSEMLSDIMVDLVEAGVVTGKKKSVHPQKIVGTFALGTRRLYQFLNDNPAVECYSVEYTNDVSIIARNHKQVAINAAIEVDLTGQVCSESIGDRHFSGTGGQVDFTRGAFLSPGGKAFICFHATAKRGTVSKVVTALKEGATVTTPRKDVHYMVTEHGVAMLKGKSMSQRAKEIIGLAAPEFREDLRRAARKMNLV